MATLIAIVYPDEFRAAEVMATLRRLQREYLLELADACYVTKDLSGKVQLHQAIDLTASGAVSGAFWGSLVGLLFFAPLLGAAVGAATGALAGSVTDYGIEDDFMRELGAQMQPGTSAIFALVIRYTEDKVIPVIGRFGGSVLRTNLSKEAEQHLQAELSGATTGTPVVETPHAVHTETEIETENR